MINEWTGVNKLFKNRFMTSNYGNIILKTVMHFLDKCYIDFYRYYADEIINSFQDFVGHAHVSPQDIYYRYFGVRRLMITGQLWS